MEKRQTPRLSLDLLRGFRLAARHLSFTRAAQELFVTQSAVSREIKTLEAQIGQPLFHRVHRALKLTDAGEQLYRVTEETLGQLDAVVDRLSGANRPLTVTTTPALASLWLAPRLPRFHRSCPDIEVRVVASNDKPNLDRDELDVGIRFVAAGGDSPADEPLMTCRSFPVCAPALARDPARPLKTPADLARHVRLDYESVRDGRSWSEWGFWFDALKIPAVEPAGTLRFPQFDQCFPAAIEGAGVAIGVLPHITQQLRDGVLCAPFGRGAVATRGAFFLVLRRDVEECKSVKQFESWLRREAAGDRGVLLPSPFATGRPPRRRPTAPARGRRSP
jgi:LysR family transcriptional regulator, glycine cleavage system transcriptional activator